MEQICLKVTAKCLIHVHHIEFFQLNPPSPYDILVCTIGHKPMLKERMTIVQDLWAAGLRAEVYLETMQVNIYIEGFFLPGKTTVNEITILNGIPTLINSLLTWELSYGLSIMILRHMTSVM